MNIKTTLTPLVALVAINSVLASSDHQENIKVIHESEVEWSHLNPKRGDLAPSAGTLWGDRNGTEPTGFLLRPPDPFESPPHIHNVSYRAVVIKGVIHNDDPDAGEMWMPVGSFWTQPKGHIHITSAEGADSLAYVEIEKGPYLVLPPEQSFDNGERPVNVDESNVVWLNAADVTWVEKPGAEIAFLWGDTTDGELNGTFIKLPRGFEGTIKSQGTTFRAVVVKGKFKHKADPTKKLVPASAFSAESPAVHKLKAYEESVIYVRTDGKYEINAN